ncbi:DNA (cytosine-5)-methyltransferase DRM2 isoform X2 [Jatropha curcas]|nr:DNA (cytosine-5)-methyltransferase DRM2 isoform X2 [Jatropha curcas]
MVHHFVNMGFSEDLVIRAIEENGKDEASILDSLLTYSALENSTEEQPHVTKSCHFKYVRNSADDHLDEEFLSRIDENTKGLLEEDESLSLLVEMGYSLKKPYSGPSAHVEELSDYISGAQLDKELDAELEDDVLEISSSRTKTRTENFTCKNKRKLDLNERLKGQGCKARKKNPQEGNEEILNLPNPMIGFGIPDEPWCLMDRRLPVLAAGKPYFYYENVALTPKGVWSKISRFLYEIEPEFVDSKYFCAAARKRGYIHNLPIQDRFPLLPRPPKTIHEALPLSKKWWPSWDTRRKFNCLLTTYGSARLTDRLRKALEDCDGEPTPSVKKYVLDQCKRWNLVWVGKNKLAPLEPDEMEILLGFPKDHTRGGGISRSDRYKGLGNSFQVDTVAYHLSVLKDRFPNGINVLSLFSGIGGAEVALHRLGIPIKNVVSVEISEVNRNIVRSWWEQTHQKGHLIEIEDIRKVDGRSLERWMHSFGGFDLVIGGSPCNNLAGGNRVSREGLEGEQSSLFYDYFRVLELVRNTRGTAED